MKYVIFNIFTLLFSTTAFAEELKPDCVKNIQASLNVLDEENSGLPDLGMGISVTNVKRITYEDVEKSIIDFKITTLGLSESEISKEGISEWYLNMANLNKLAFDKVQGMGFLEDSKAKRLAHLLVNDIVAGWVSRATAITMHERAHSTAAENTGATDITYGMSGMPDKELGIGGLFLGLLSGKGGASTSYYKQGGFSPEDLTLISAAGINSQKTFAQNLSEDMLKKRKVHVADTVNYAINKLSYEIYYTVDQDSSQSDLKSYFDGLEGQGYIATGSAKSHMDKAAKLSALTSLMSGRTIDVYRANAQYIKTGKTSVDILAFPTPYGKVTLPEMNVYLNRTNVSVNTSMSLLKENGTTYTASIEKSVYGENVTEYNVAAHIPYRNFTIAPNVTANTRGGFGTGVEMGYDVENSKWEVFGGVTYDKETLKGERRFLIPDSFKKQTSLYIGFKYNY
jgi:hypothetical protein